MSFKISTLLINIKTRLHVLKAYTGRMCKRHRFAKWTQLRVKKVRETTLDFIMVMIELSDFEQLEPLAVLNLELILL